MTHNELIRQIESLRSLMVSVATGGPRIDEVNPDYQKAFGTVDRELRRRRIPILFPIQIYGNGMAGGEVGIYHPISHDATFLQTFLRLF